MVISTLIAFVAVTLTVAENGILTQIVPQLYATFPNLTQMVFYLLAMAILCILMVLGSMVIDNLKYIFVYFRQIANVNDLKDIGMDEGHSEYLATTEVRNMRTLQLDVSKWSRKTQALGFIVYSVFMLL